MPLARARIVARVTFYNVPWNFYCRFCEKVLQRFGRA